MWRRERRTILLQTSSEDATQVTASDREEGVRATKPIRTFRITVSMVATKVIEKESLEKHDGMERT